MHVLSRLFHKSIVKLATITTQKKILLNSRSNEILTNAFWIQRSFVSFQTRWKTSKNSNYFVANKKKFLLLLATSHHKLSYLLLLYIFLFILFRYRHHWMLQWKMFVHGNPFGKQHPRIKFHSFSLKSMKKLFLCRWKMKRKKKNVNA